MALALFVLAAGSLAVLFAAAMASAAWYWRLRAEGAEAELSRREAPDVGRPTPPPVGRLDIGERERWSS